MINSKRANATILSLLLSLVLIFVSSSLVLGHFIVPMQVDRQGYSVNLQMIQWYEGYENTGEPSPNDIDVAGITDGRVVMNVYVFDSKFEPINEAEVTLRLTSGETELGPWNLEQFADASYTITEDIPTAGKWDAFVQYVIPEENTPVNARFVEFEVNPSDPALAAGGVIEDPTESSSGTEMPWWLWVIGGTTLVGIALLIIFGMTQGRKDGTSQEEQREQES